MEDTSKEIGELLDQIYAKSTFQDAYFNLQLSMLSIKRKESGNFRKNVETF